MEVAKLNTLKSTDLNKISLSCVTLYINFENKLFPVANDLAMESTEWCDQYSITLQDAIDMMCVDREPVDFKMKYSKEFWFANYKRRESPADLGVMACGELLYYCAEELSAKSIIETGVAFGWSSLYLLLSLDNRDEGRLYSTDIPYLVEPHIHLKSHKYVGCVVPPILRDRWSVIKKRDRTAIPKAIKMANQIDLCHYDSDETYRGRMFAYPLLWESIRPGGIFISDDVSDNQAFRVFCEQIEETPVIVKLEYKYVGIIFKN